eukprot:CAMPEP_0176011074 /NCGR_PEP_ID=MMETSP0120_2-20121206/5098_1 /TAXON_ID=160619 /ORGANISM="Kryptoperidinium foliaceum, Strain CCMP 1326" /LENGTH=116 /DNA_ID=CAMNT_0017343929 /DNA_START=206 /DNA_END=553 /DNA_ORIENTATION=-
MKSTAMNIQFKMMTLHTTSISLQVVMFTSVWNRSRRRPIDCTSLVIRRMFKRPALCWKKELRSKMRELARKGSMPTRQAPLRSRAPSSQGISVRYGKDSKWIGSLRPGGCRDTSGT